MPIAVPDLAGVLLMSILRLLLILLVALFASQLCAADSAPPLVSVVANDFKSVMGELVRENDTHIEVLDLKTGESTIFKKTDLKSIRKDVSERSCIERFSLPVYMAWRVKKVLPIASASGKIAQLDGAVIYVTIGSDVGLEAGKELIVYRGETEINDPDSGKVLGKQKRKIAKLEAISVEDKLTKAKMIDDLEITLEVGDIVEPAVVSNSVAILPMVNSTGNETEGTKRIAEQLTTGLVNRGVSVVERRLLDKVLGELGLQQGSAFDPSKAQKVGKQLGVYAIVVGSVAPKGKIAEAHLRLVRVETGEILVAATQVLKDVGDVAASTTATQPTGKKTKQNKMTLLLPVKKQDDLSKFWELPENENNWQIINGGLKLPGSVGQLKSVFLLRGDCEVWFTCNTAGWKGPSVGMFGERIDLPPAAGGFPISYSVRIVRKDEDIVVRVALTQPGLKRNLDETLKVTIKPVNADKPAQLIFFWPEDMGFTISAVAISEQSIAKEDK